MHIDKPAPKHLDESGMLLIQVILLSGILLALIYSGFSTVRTAIQSANTAATSAGFQDFLLSVQQNLSLSQTCFERIGKPNGVGVQAVLNGNGVFPVKIYKSPGQVLHQVESAGMPPGSPDFKIKELNLRAFRSLGRKAVGQSIVTNQYAGVLSIVAERRSEYLGGKEMRAEIPLVFQATAGNALFGCSLRSIYQVELGPPILKAGIQRKSGLECIDRGGVPVMRPDRDYYLCRIPDSTLQNCGSINETEWGSSNPEGWWCELGEPSNRPRVAYAY